MAKKKVDVFEVVNTRILEALEKGVVPWKKPWHSSQEACPQEKHIEELTYLFLGSLP